MRVRWFLVGLVVGAAAWALAWTWARGPGRPPNLLVVVLDDVGPELIGAYGHEGAARTPTLDALAARGTRFDVAWALPVCSPTRAALLTGRMPRAFGIGGALHLEREPVGLPPGAATLAELLRQAPVPYATAYVGKWHLTPRFEKAAGSAPLRHGFDLFVGSLGNLAPEHALDRRPQSYTDWERVVNGEAARSGAYVTTQTIDDALAVIGQLPEPWFVVVALHAAHTPWHVPPGRVRDPAWPRGEKGEIRAMLEVADAELGRLLGGLGEAVGRTVVLATADNGSSDNAGVGPFAGKPAKATVWELGVRVPLVVAGPGVAEGRGASALAHVVDVAPTLLGLAGVDVQALRTPFDGVDLRGVLADPSSAGPRTTLVSEVFVPNGRGPYERWDAAVRDARYKLVRPHGKAERLYRIDDSLVEPAALAEPLDAEAEAARARLGAVLDGMGAPQPELPLRRRKRDGPSPP